ncbi:MAG: class I SAM-dependent methyltransferase [Thermodesulfobacteriota bacterium]
MDALKSRDYHDYFIKDGRFIGRFEEMYQNVEDPWHIETLGRRLDMDAALLLLRHIGRDFQKVLDVGCGKGFFTSLLAEAVSGRILAGDVSETAINQARRRYPDPRLEFFVLDLNRIEELPHPAGYFDLIVMAQTIWCVLPNLTRILGGFHRLLAPTGALLLSQHFLKPEEQKYGREILNTPQDLIRLLQESGFDIKEYLETNRFTNHHLALWATPHYKDGL